MRADLLRADLLHVTTLRAGLIICSNSKPELSAFDGGAVVVQEPRGSKMGCARMPVQINVRDAPACEAAGGRLS